MPGLFYTGSYNLQSAASPLVSSQDLKLESYFYNSLQVAPGRWWSGLSVVNFSVGTGANFDEYQQYDVDALTLNMSWDVGFGVITSITGWQQANDSVGQDFDGSDRFSPAVPLVQLKSLMLLHGLEKPHILQHTHPHH